MPENRVILKRLFSVIFHFPILLEVLISFLQIAFLQLHPIFTLCSVLVSFNQILASPVVLNDTHKLLLFSGKISPCSETVKGRFLKVLKPPRKFDRISPA